MRWLAFRSAQARIMVNRTDRFHPSGRQNSLNKRSHHCMYRYRNTIVGLLLSVTATSCTCQTYREHTGGLQPKECPSDLERAVRITGIALPIELPADFLASQGPLSVRGTLARRIVLSIVPTRLASGTRIVEADISLSSLGGTFRGWTQLQTEYTSISSINASPLISTRHRHMRPEVATVRFDTGLIQIHRVALERVNLAGVAAVDALIIPGRSAIDETVLRISKLWDSDKRPIKPEALDVVLVPLRHVATYDPAAALVNLKYILETDHAEQTFSCSAAEEHVELIDRDAVRQPYWDLGVPKGSVLGPYRDRMLALFSPSGGAVRAVFESPSAATAFATWIRETQATTAGPYTLGVFNGIDPLNLRTLLPLDKDILETFRSLSPDDREGMRAGALGEP
jgi:hypothetical protein